jgi:hypothetical protein
MVRERVYFALSGTEVKIGISNNPRNRIRGMRTVRPDIKLLADIPGDQETEAYLHQRFREFRITGEWFHYTKEIEDFVRGAHRTSSALKTEEERFLTRKLLSERWKQYGYSENSIRRGEKTLGLQPYRFLRDVRYRLTDILRIERDGQAKMSKRFTGLRPDQKA